MAGRQVLRTAIVTAVAILSLSVAGPAALAASADTTPPSAPRLTYATGYYCLTLIVGVIRSTDDRTPQSQLTYDVFADGSRIASMADNGGYSGVYSIQHLAHAAPNPITVKAVDAAGNRSAPSTGWVARPAIPADISGASPRQFSPARQRCQDSPDML